MNWYKFCQSNIEVLQENWEWAKKHNVEVTNDGYFVLYLSSPRINEIRKSGKIEEFTELYTVNHGNKDSIKVKVNPEDLFCGNTCRTRRAIKLLETK